MLTHPERLRFGGMSVQSGPDRLGDLRERSPSLDDTDAIRRAFESDGWVFLPGLLDRETVEAAREELLLKYAIVGEIDDRFSLDEAIAGDRAGLPTANLRVLTESLRRGSRYESVILAPELIDVVGSILGGAVQPYDFRWPRLARPGEGCGFHCDGPYMNRGTDRHLSTWIPLGRIEPHEGALMILEGSHDNHELAEGYLRKDADRDGLVWLSDDPAEVQERYGKRWLTTTFEPGDVLVFSMSCVHGALDNESIEGRCRLSTDSRYLLAGEVPDERWNGDDLNPHGEGRVFYPGLGNWENADFQDEWKFVDERGRLVLPDRAPDPEH
ncbi:MAG: phytanoyl-CoA dioxygenase family protein [Acidimicrobiales bacterium]